jgi:radical SAM protein with 4Fe4S-binding SPASM domain
MSKSYRALARTWGAVKSVGARAGLSNAMDEASWLLKPLFVRQSFTGLHIEPTNVCNYACIMCPHYKLKRKQGFMDFALYEEVIRQALDAGVRVVRLQMYGEPLAHPRIVDMVRHAKEKGLKVDFTSNAGLMTEDKARALLEAGLDKITFSFEGATKATYERVMRNGNFEAAVKNINGFLRVRDELGSPAYVAMNTLVMPETAGEVDAAVEMWKDKVDVVNVAGTSDQAGKTEYRWVGEKAKRKRPPCYALWNGLAVYWNGDASVCCVDSEGELIVGNVKDAPLKEIWMNKKMQAFRKLHLQRRFDAMPLCAKCEAYLEEKAVKHVVNPHSTRKPPGV